MRQKIIFIKENYEKFKSQKDQKKADELFNTIKKELSTFKFTSLFIEKLIGRIENISSDIAKYEKDIYSLCTEYTTLSKKEFLKLFKNNETNIDILDQILNSHLKASADKESFKKEFSKINKKLVLIESNQKISIQDIKILIKIEDLVK